MTYPNYAQRLYPRHPQRLYPLRDDSLFDSGSSSPATDPLFSKVVLLVQFDGSSGSQTFTDQSSYGLTPSTVAGSADIVPEPNWNGYSVADLTRTGDYVRYDNSSLFAFSGNQAWTAEAFIWFNSNAADQMPFGYFDSVAQGWGLYTRSPQELTFYIAATFVHYDELIGPGSSFVTSQWMHVAIEVNSSKKMRLYVDGSCVASMTISNIDVNASVFKIGAGDTRELNNGYMKNLRVTRDVRYDTDGSYTVPTSEFPTS